MATEKGVGYVRVSTQEQVKGGVSLDAQVERLRAYALLAGLDLVEIIREEGVSAATPIAHRPGGQRLIQLVAGKKPVANHVVALKLDRLFRDAADALNQTRAWDHSGVALHLVDMGGQSLNTASAMGRMILTMLAGFAEWERNLIAERTADALAHKKANGVAYGQTPFGYQRKDTKLTEDPQELKAHAGVVVQVMLITRD
jgi:DNA invertase Pin-like site-specific DNA recombinase